MSLCSPNRGAAIVVAMVLAIAPVLQAMPHAPVPAAVSQTAKAPAKAQPATPVDGGWPRTYNSTQGRIVVYEPQIASWANQAQMVAFAATSYQPKAAAA